MRPRRTFPAPATQAGCRWLLSPNLENAPATSPYTVDSIVASVRFVPEHIIGDRDFSGNGPVVNYRIRPFISSEGFGVQLTMRAQETKDDWTTVKGNSGDLWFLRVRTGWKLRTVGRVDSTYGQPFVVPGSTFAIPQQREWQHETEAQYVDQNHDVEEIRTGAGVAELAAFREIESKHQVVGDTKGDEAGTRTGIRVHTWINAYELCPG